jgi:hypothetical protein
VGKLIHGKAGNRDWQSEVIMEGNENTQMNMMTFCEICGMAFIDRVQLNEHLL